MVPSVSFPVSWLPNFPRLRLKFRCFVLFFSTPIRTNKNNVLRSSQRRQSDLFPHWYPVRTSNLQPDHNPAPVSASVVQETLKRTRQPSGLGRPDSSHREVGFSFLSQNDVRHNRFVHGQCFRGARRRRVLLRMQYYVLLGSIDAHLSVHVLAGACKIC